ncbi:hypothetical protein M405DRAFT_878183 [Rhizopogon salebrosus TDB-379]|nr:hypothetical protein M405DRAFT_878183 [Rhizopogon salebrosus TDB-379]
MALDGRIIHPILEYLPIQVLDPFRIDIAIKDDPVSLTAFSTDVTNNLARDGMDDEVAAVVRRLLEVRKLLQGGGVEGEDLVEGSTVMVGLAEKGVFLLKLCWDEGGLLEVNHLVAPHHEEAVEAAVINLSKVYEEGGVVVNEPGGVSTLK